MTNLLIFFVLLVIVQNLSFVSPYAFVGAELGGFFQCAHDLRGKVFVKNDREIYIRGFCYDGKGPAAWFHGQLRGSKGIHSDNARNFKILPYPVASCYRLTQGLALKNEDIRLILPVNVSIHDFASIGIVCYQSCHNYGHFLIPKNLKVPKAPDTLLKTWECKIHKKDEGGRLLEEGEEEGTGDHENEHGEGNEPSEKAEDKNGNAKDGDGGGDNDKNGQDKAHDKRDTEADDDSHETMTTIEWEAGGGKTEDTAGGKKKKGNPQVGAKNKSTTVKEGTVGENNKSAIAKGDTGGNTKTIEKHETEHSENEKVTSTKEREEEEEDASSHEEDDHFDVSHCTLEMMRNHEFVPKRECHGGPSEQMILDSDIDSSATALHSNLIVLNFLIILQTPITQ